jgi:hypothetical protein
MDISTSGDTYADAGYLRHTNDNNATAQIYPGLGIDTVETSSSDDYVGMPVYKIGQTTGKSASQIVDIKNVSYGGSFEYNTLYNARITDDTDSADGDSGGTVYHVMWEGTEKQSYRLSGILNGEYNHPSLGDQIMYYSHVSYVIKELNLSSVVTY